MNNGSLRLCVFRSLILFLSPKNLFKHIYLKRILSAFTCEEILDPTSMSNWQLCVEDEASGLLLDIDRVPDWREEHICKPLVFVLLWFLKKAFCQERIFQEGLVPISGRDDVVMKSTWYASSYQFRLAISHELHRLEASRSVSDDVPRGTWTDAVERARVSALRQANSKGAIRDFLSKRSLPTHA